MANRLAAEKSPYLQQHADNPVEWYPWGSEAFETARREKRPLLISIGYSACHWCHVMAHESFEDPATAALMNRLFVNVKVDREERPDVDAIYMEAVQALTGQGGWPLNVFVTPEGRPFYGGTYFPPTSRHGLPSWRDVLKSIDAAYRERPSDVERSAESISQYIRRSQTMGQSGTVPGPDVLKDAYATVAAQFDRDHGGFGGAPKFPQPLALDFVQRMHVRLDSPEAREFVEQTLRAMSAGGIYDQLGGGFHRYTVDAGWVVPHFEKMLYDNALLVPVYLHAYQLTQEPLYRSIVEGTLDYLVRVMRSPERGFYSAEDADSEGVEGKYYVWTPDEVDALLSPDESRAACLRFGVRSPGNFEGKTILTVAASLDTVAAELGLTLDEASALLERASAKLLIARAQRVPPVKDTKIITAWNALAIAAFAEAGAVLERADYLRTARETAAFVLSELRPEGQLVRSYRDGPSSIPAFLEDYAFLAGALITLYESSFDPAHLDAAVQLAEEMRRRFRDEEHGAFFDTQVAGELVVRPRSFYDNPIPSGNSAAAMTLLRLDALTGDPSLAADATAAFDVVGNVLARAPLGFSHLLSALDFYQSTPLQIAVAGDQVEQPAREMLRVVFQRYLPNRVLAAGTAGEPALLEGRHTERGTATAYVCRHFACDVPAHDAATLASQLDAAATAGGGAMPTP